MHLFCIFNRNTGDLVRVVECEEMMVTMSGPWNSDYSYIKWETCFELIQRYKKANEAMDFSYLSHGQGD